MSEKRYIDKARLIKAIEDLPNCYNGFSDTFDKACIIGVIEELPTIDIIGIIAEHAENVQELVLCKDCRWYEIYQLKKDGTEDRRCKPEFCALHSRKFPGDYFCADGERREDER